MQHHAGKYAPVLRQALVGSLAHELGATIAHGNVLAGYYASHAMHAKSVAAANRCHFLVPL